MDEKSVQSVTKRRLLRNAVLVYAGHGVRLLIPLLVTPVLTGRFSAGAYGMTAYARSLMTNVQTFVDFGFNTSSVAEIARAGEDRGRIGRITGDTIRAKTVLAVLAVIGMSGFLLQSRMSPWQAGYLMLSLCPVLLSVFLPDFLFCGLEKMEVNTFAFVGMKAGTGLGTILLVQGDRTMWLIPVLDLLFTAAGILYYKFRIRKLSFPAAAGKKGWIRMTADSFWYFAADFLPALYGTASTLFLASMLEEKPFACWCLAWQIYTSARGLYEPARTVLFPYMARRKKRGHMLRGILLTAMPAVAAGCLIGYIGAGPAAAFLGKGKYPEAAAMFRSLIPVLFISFPSMAFGWLALGAAGEKKQLLWSSAVGLLLQLSGFAVLSASGLSGQGDVVRGAAAVLFCAEAGVLLVRLWYWRKGEGKRE